MTPEEILNHYMQTVHNSFINFYERGLTNPNYASSITLLGPLAQKLSEMENAYSNAKKEITQLNLEDPKQQEYLSQLEALRNTVMKEYLKVNKAVASNYTTEPLPHKLFENTPYLLELQIKMKASKQPTSNENNVSKLNKGAEKNQSQTSESGLTSIEINKKKSLSMKQKIGIGIGVGMLVNPALTTMVAVGVLLKNSGLFRHNKNYTVNDKQLEKKDTHKKGMSK